MDSISVISSKWKAPNHAAPHMCMKATNGTTDEISM